MSWLGNGRSLRQAGVGDGRGQLRRAVGLALVALVPLALAACGSTAGTTTPPTPVLPTVAVPSDCAGVGLVDATLNGDPADPRIAWLDLKGYGRKEVVFPLGYTARFVPSLEVLDEGGHPVARAGDRIEGGCVVGLDADPLLILWPTDAPSLAAAGQQLRITNAGDADLADLDVLFPGARVSFGDILAGQTTEYRAVPCGVYRYAAYEYTLDGQRVRQPVADWVGESPIEGTLVTYRLVPDRQLPAGRQIRLEQVVVDSR